ncbi:NAD(P)H-binding protein [Pediococcus inopinatus]|uniref:NAD(P)H-binding protein n=1 Tax=Pediococcus inopinatus TaxID=114090 RepID=UPI002B262973|nr:NAD(P)H-binding protein [Pediococcus inopinatus]WPC17264.1 NAD(P)H-binding protein [Pediococcus inopinatus]
MAKIMIIGAYGKMAQLLTEKLLNETNDELILFLRNAQRLNKYADNPRVELVDGDVLDTDQLADAMQEAEIIYSNLGGVDLADQIQSVLNAMKRAQKERFVYISSLGAHHEVSGKYGEWNEQAIGAYLPGFRKAAQLVSESGLKYTEIRPAWLTDKDEVAYETTQVDEPFKGTEVSRKSVADFAFQVVTQPQTHVNESVGLNKPDTDGDKPSWI